MRELILLDVPRSAAGRAARWLGPAALAALGLGSVVAGVLMGLGGQWGSALMLVLVGLAVLALVPLLVGHMRRGLYRTVVVSFDERVIRFEHFRIYGTDRRPQLGVVAELFECPFEEVVSAHMTQAARNSGELLEVRMARGYLYLLPGRAGFEEVRAALEGIADENAGE